MASGACRQCFARGKARKCQSNNRRAGGGIQMDSWPVGGGCSLKGEISEMDYSEGAGGFQMDL